MFLHEDLLDRGCSVKGRVLGQGEGDLQTGQAKSLAGGKHPVFLGSDLGSVVGTAAPAMLSLSS